MQDITYMLGDQVFCGTIQNNLFASANQCNVSQAELKSKNEERSSRTINGTGAGRLIIIFLEPIQIDKTIPDVVMKAHIFNSFKILNAIFKLWNHWTISF